MEKQRGTTNPNSLISLIQAGGDVLVERIPFFAHFEPISAICCSNLNKNSKKLFFLALLSSVRYWFCFLSETRFLV